MTKNYFKSKKCILFWAGKPGGCVSSGSVESCLVWAFFGHLLWSPVEYLPGQCCVASEIKGLLFGAFYSDCHNWAWIAKQMCTD